MQSEWGVGVGEAGGGGGGGIDIHRKGERKEVRKAKRNMYHIYI